MSPEKQRIAIAKACGWKRTEHKYDNNDSAGWSWVAPDRVGRNLPDYLNDLNAMHEAEKFLNNQQKVNYCFGLSGGNPMGLHADLVKAVSATAAQRAEAFLRTLNLWEEE